MEAQTDREKKEKALERARVILEVRSGKRTATEGPKESPEALALKERLEALEKENAVLRQSEEVQRVLSMYREWRDRPKGGSKKKPK